MQPYSYCPETKIIPIGSPGYGGYYAGTVHSNIIVVSKDKRDTGQLHPQYDWDSAKKYCLNFESNGFSDWDLPYFQELDAIWINSEKLGEVSGEFARRYYWSKTGLKNSDYMCYLDFATRFVDYTHKSTKCFVRPIRRISVEKL